MNFASRLVLVSSFIWPMVAFCQPANRSGAINVVAASRLPESAPMPSDSMFLGSSDDGATYLYLEQHDHNRLVVLV